MFSNILVPVDLMDEARAQAIAALGASLLNEGGTLRLLHVVPIVPTYAEAYMPAGLYDEGLKEAQAAVEEIAAAADVTAQIKVVTGYPHSEILEDARQTPPDLIIIGSHRPGLSDYFLGSTAARVVRHAQCSVLVDR